MYRNVIVSDTLIPSYPGMPLYPGISLYPGMPLYPGTGADACHGGYFALFCRPDRGSRSRMVGIFRGWYIPGLVDSGIG